MGGGATPRGEQHPLVKISKVYERLFGQRMDHHICVTNAMKGWLASNWGIDPVVLYDKPPTFFHKCDVEEKHRLFQRLPAFSEGCKKGETLFTRRDNKSGEISLRDDRPALIISSTSWTVDEDFHILLEAIQNLNERTCDDASFPALMFVITGKGKQPSPLAINFTVLHQRVLHALLYSMNGLH